uniref:Maltase activator n=1 Tax=Ogataea thermomethanolica (nom. inval.) TaxID=310468 RepID=A0A2Z5WAC2_9ASCO|nr:maltase activator [Ogataea thermomethanolica (nom. inval.)]
MNGLRRELGHRNATRPKRVYTRPCDICAFRRVRCDLEQRNGPCTNCTIRGVKCTRDRIRRKSGPKNIHRKTEEAIRFLVEVADRRSANQTNVPDIQNEGLSEQATYENNTISLNELRPLLTIFSIRYYALWPVLFADQLLAFLESSCSDINGTSCFKLEPANACVYALCCAVCGVVSCHIGFWSNEELTEMAHLGLNICPPPEKYIMEAERAIFEFNLDSRPTEDQVLCNFFLHVYYSSGTEDNLQELLYLRQAISCAQMLHLGDNDMVEETVGSSHQFRKIYYLLLITERYVSFKKQLPVILEPTLSLPRLEDDPHPTLLSGFLELAQVFSVPDCMFFNKYSLEGKSSVTDMLTETFDHLFKNFWIRDMQTRLANSVVKVQNQSQKVNILISRAWLQSIAWTVAKGQQLLSKTGNQSDFFDYSYPIHLAREFLVQTRDMPYEAFETNGKGVVVKLNEVANTLLAYIRADQGAPETVAAFDELAYIHGIIMRQNSHLNLDGALNPVTELLEARRFGFRHISYGSPAHIDPDSSRFEDLDSNEADSQLFPSSSDQSHKFWSN